MKYLALVSILINAGFGYYLFLAPTGLVERSYQHSTHVAWERDPAFVASMTKLVDDSMWTDVMGMYLPHHQTIIAPEPKNNLEMIVLAHEFMHAMNYKHSD